MHTGDELKRFIAIKIEKCDHYSYKITELTVKSHRSQKN